MEEDPDARAAECRGPGRAGRPDDGPARGAQAREQPGSPGAQAAHPGSDHARRLLMSFVRLMPAASVVPARGKRCPCAPQTCLARLSGMVPRCRMEPRMKTART